jgi:hypothetical protein
VSPLEFIAESLPWWHQYVLLVALFLALHLPLIRRWVVGMYDPLLLLLLANVFGWAIVWFMYLRGDIATVYVVSFTVAQLAFYLGIGLGRPREPLAVAVPAAPSSVTPAKLTLAMAAGVHMASTLSTWAIAGIPLFRSSRLGAFEGSGGYGILERLSESSALIAIFAVVYLLIHHAPLRRSIVVRGFLLWYLVSIGLSGSKGALLSLGQAVLSIVYVYTSLRQQKDRFWAGRAGKVLLIGSTVFALGVLAAQQDSDVTAALLGFVYRVVSYGDVYIFAYPDATIESIRGDNPLIGLFGGFLSTFRLFPQEFVYPNIGYQFTGIVFPDLDLIVGPNPQHPVFGYHYFGSFGFLFSFALGLVTAGAHTRFYLRRHSTFFSGLIAFGLYFSLVNISVDFEYTLSKLASLIIGLVVVVGPVLLLHPHTALVRPSRRTSALARPESGQPT